MGLRMSELIPILVVLGVVAFIVMRLRKPRTLEPTAGGAEGRGAAASNQVQPRKPYFTKRTAILAGVLLVLFGGAYIVNIVGEWQDERAERQANGGRTRAEIQREKDYAERRASEEARQREVVSRRDSEPSRDAPCDPELTREEIVAIGDRCDEEAEAQVQAMCNGSARCLERNKPEIPKLSKLCYSLRKSNKCKTWR